VDSSSKQTIRRFLFADEANQFRERDVVVRHEFEKPIEHVIYDVWRDHRTSGESDAFIHRLLITLERAVEHHPQAFVIDASVNEFAVRVVHCEVAAWVDESEVYQIPKCGRILENLVPALARLSNQFNEVER
jgi:hypothetical protein